jgi:hypothetical protein
MQNLQYLLADPSMISTPDTEEIPDFKINGNSGGESPIVDRTPAQLLIAKIKISALKNDMTS